jgi:hypothetical protein
LASCGSDALWLGLPCRLVGICCGCVPWLLKWVFLAVAKSEYTSYEGTAEGTAQDADELSQVLTLAIISDLDLYILYKAVLALHSSST